jgi:hypothetical protein
MSLVLSLILVSKTRSIPVFSGYGTGVTKKEGEMISGVEIPNILNTNSTRFAGNF